MYKKFLGLPTLGRILLMIIPIANWITEIVIRWDKAAKTKGLLDVIMALIFTFGGIVLGYLDLIYHILTGKLLLVD